MGEASPSAMRWPARLPLSTEEIYLGLNARRSVVSYQLSKWPRYRSNFFIDPNVASSRSDASNCSKPSEVMCGDDREQIEFPNWSAMCGER